MSYSAAIPALAPLASGSDDDPAPAIAQGDLLNHYHVTQATSQHQNRKVLHKVHLATPAEVVASKIRKTLVVAEHAAQAAGGRTAGAVENQDNTGRCLVTRDQRPQHWVACLVKTFGKREGSKHKPRKSD